MNALWIGSTWPEHRKSAAGVRARQLIDWLAAAGWTVTVASTARETDATEDLRAAGRFCQRVELNDPSFDTFLVQLQPDLVVFDRFMVEEAFSWRVRGLLPGALRVLDTIDLHGLREFRQTQAAAGNPVELTELPPTRSEVWLRELAAIHRSDLSLLVSPAEIDMVHHAGIAPGRSALVPLAAQVFERPAPSFAERSGFASIGNFRHPPNRDSFEQLVRCWPKLRAELPEASMHIYGAFAPKAVMERHAPAKGFHVHGQVGNAMMALAQHRLLLAPLRSGAGVKGKVLDAWACGTPVIASPVAAEGMMPGGQFAGFVTASNNPAEIVEPAVALYADEAAWNTAQSTAKTILAEAFDPKRLRAEFLGQLTRALDQKDARREANTTGAMLWLQSLRSTEYFARYLEEKAKRS